MNTMFTWNTDIPKDFWKRCNRLVQPPREVTFNGNDIITSITIVEGSSTRRSSVRGTVTQGELHLKNDQDNTFQVVKCNGLDNEGILFTNMLSEFSQRTDKSGKYPKLLLLIPIKYQLIKTKIANFKQLYP